MRCGIKYATGGLLSLLLLLSSLPLFSDEPGPSEMTTEQIINELFESLNERERLLDEKEQVLNSRRQELQTREIGLQARREDLNARESWLEERRTSLVEIENSLQETARSLESYDAAVRAEIRFWKITTGVAAAGVVASLIFTALH